MFFRPPYAGASTATCKETRWQFASPDNRIKTLLKEPVFGYEAVKAQLDALRNDIQGINEARFQIALGINALIAARNLEDRLGEASRYYG